MSQQTSATVAGLSLRAAERGDVPLILRFIRELAEFERLSDQVAADEAALQSALFGPRRFAEAVIARYRDVDSGFALFFHTFSTFAGRPGLYLEDLYVTPEARGRGIGRALLAHLAGVAVARDCARLELSVLHWNEPAIRLYHRLGAEPMKDWMVHRISGAALTALAGSQ